MASGRLARQVALLCAAVLVLAATVGVDASRRSRNRNKFEVAANETAKGQRKGKCNSIFFKKNVEKKVLSLMKLLRCWYDQVWISRNSGPVHTGEVFQWISIQLHFKNRAWPTINGNIKVKISFHLFLVMSRLRL